VAKWACRPASLFGRAPGMPRPFSMPMVLAMRFAMSLVNRASGSFERRALDRRSRFIGWRKYSQTKGDEGEIKGLLHCP